jgi:hypothetical protein
MCGSFFDLTFFSIGYFKNEDTGNGKRAYIYMTVLNYRLCLGVTWKN